MQCPYYIHNALAPLFDLPLDKIRVVQMETGGGFGGKEEYPSVIAGHAALLAWKSGRPVKLIYDRAEDMAATTKRHPSRTRHRTAVDADGRLLAMDIDFASTAAPTARCRRSSCRAGRFTRPGRTSARTCASAAARSPPTRRRTARSAASARRRASSRSSGTWTGSPRPPGSRPEELRRRNFIKRGQTSAVGQTISRAGRHAGPARSRARALAATTRSARVSPRIARARCGKGIGLATFMHGAGFTGSGEDHLASVVAVEGGADGRVRVLTASTEIGQGTNTIFAQIAADALGMPLDAIEVVQPDTAVVPNSGPTVASRTCMVVGKLVETAALAFAPAAGRRASARRDLTPPTDFTTACQTYLAHQRAAARPRAQYRPPPGLRWDDERYQGDAYGTYAWAVYVAEVTVDLTTCEMRVDDFVAVQEVGKVINPVLAAGQIEGGVAQGIGWALYEQVVWREGRMVNAPDDQLHHADLDGPAAHPRLLRGASVRRRARRARRASASCRWTARRRPSSTPSRMRPASTRPRLPLTPESLMDLLEAARA